MTKPLIIVCILFLAANAFAQQHKPLIGVIRWDAWISSHGKVGEAIEASLSPKKWHYRLPFYAKITSDSTVKIDGTSPAVMQREIAYAAFAGINYWAFVTYAENDPMSVSLHNYLNIKNKKGVNFCLITETDRWGNPDAYQQEAKRYAALATNPAAQKVLSGRPLLYILGYDMGIIKKWKSLKNFKQALDGYRKLVVSHGIKTPYIVLMGGAAADIDSLGVDAISAYNTADWNSKTLLPYASLAHRTESIWNSWKQSGVQCVPTVMAGTDRRPRLEHPVFWENPDMVNQPAAYTQATPEEFIAHVRNARKWIEANKASCPANTFIVYAWNEFDEGGWIEPTLNIDGSVNTSMLKALKKGVQ